MHLFKLAICVLFAIPTAASAGTKCEERTVSGHHTKMCMETRGAFKHWIFSLEVDGETIFTLIDDYSESIILTHTLPEGLALELPLSQQGKKSISISGGCVPVSHSDGTEVARKCNFMWGNVPIVKDIVFIH
jgi:hypothetical protein